MHFIFCHEHAEQLQLASRNMYKTILIFVTSKMQKTHVIRLLQLITKFAIYCFYARKHWM